MNMRKYLLLTLPWLLAACANNDMSDLRTYVDEVRAVPFGYRADPGDQTGDWIRLRRQRTARPIHATGSGK